MGLSLALEEWHSTRKNGMLWTGPTCGRLDSRMFHWEVVEPLRDGVWREVRGHWDRLLEAAMGPWSLSVTSWLGQCFWSALCSQLGDCLTTGLKATVPGFKDWGLWTQEPKAACPLLGQLRSSLPQRKPRTRTRERQVDSRPRGRVLGIWKRRWRIQRASRAVHTQRHWLGEGGAGSPGWNQ